MDSTRDDQPTEAAPRDGGGEETPDVQGVQEMSTAHSDQDTQDPNGSDPERTEEETPSLEDEPDEHEEPRVEVERPPIFALIQSEIRDLCATAAPKMRDRSVPKTTRAALRKTLREAFAWEDLQNDLDPQQGMALIRRLEALTERDSVRADTSFMGCPPDVLYAMWPLRVIFIFDRGVPKNTPILYEMGERRVDRFQALVGLLSSEVQNFIAEGGKRPNPFANLPSPRAALPIVEG